MRRTVPDLIDRVASDLPDNDEGLITPAIVRDIMNDTIDSLSTVVCRIAGMPLTAPVIALNPTPIPVPASFFTLSTSPSPDVVEARADPFADILSHTSVGMLHLTLAVTMSASGGVDVLFYFAKNGVLVPFRATLSGSGLTDFQSTMFSWTFEDIADGDVFQLYIGSSSSAVNVTLRSAQMTGIIFPKYTL